MSRFLAAAVVVAAIVFAAPLTLNSAPPSAAGRAMSDAAGAFLKDLNAEQRSKATFKFDDDSRFEFRFTPRARTGLPLKDMIGGAAGQGSCPAQDRPQRARLHHRDHDHRSRNRAARD